MCHPSPPRLRRSYIPDTWRLVLASAAGCGGPSKGRRRPFVVIGPCWRWREVHAPPVPPGLAAEGGADRLQHRQASSMAVRRRSCCCRTTDVTEHKNTTRVGGGRVSSPVGVSQYCMYVCMTAMPAARLSTYLVPRFCHLGPRRPRHRSAGTIRRRAGRWGRTSSDISTQARSGHSSNDQVNTQSQEDTSRVKAVRTQDTGC